MKRAALLAAIALAGTASCEPALKHPGITTGIASGMIALVPCLPAVEHPTTCLAVGAIVGLALGGLTGLITTFADTSAHELPPDVEPVEPVHRIRTTTPPPPSPAPAEPASPPVQLDAGVAATADAAT